MNKGKLYVPKGSKLYVAAIILAIIYVILKAVKAYLTGGIYEYSIMMSSETPYLSYIMLVAELCIPLGFLLSRKSLKFAALGNLAILIFTLVLGIEASRSLYSQLHSPGGGWLILLGPFFVLIIIVLPLMPSGISTLVLMFSSRSQMAFTIVPSLCMFFYALGNSNILFSSGEYKIIANMGEAAYMLLGIITPITTVLTLTSAYICLGLSLKNEVLPIEQQTNMQYPFYPMQPQYPQYQQYPPQYQPMVYGQPAPMQQAQPVQEPAAENTNDVNT